MPPSAISVLTANLLWGNLIALLWVLLAGVAIGRFSSGLSADHLETLCRTSATMATAKFICRTHVGVSESQHAEK